MRGIKTFYNDRSEQFSENHTKQEKPDHDDYIHTYFIDFPQRDFSKTIT